MTSARERRADAEGFQTLVGGSHFGAEDEKPAKNNTIPTVDHLVTGNDRKNQARRASGMGGIPALARLQGGGGAGVVQRRGAVGGFVAELPPMHGGTKVVVVDLVARDGEQVRIELSGASGKEVVAPAEAFRKRGGFADPKWFDYNLRKIRKWNLTPEFESRILGGNAARVIP